MTERDAAASRAIRALVFTVVLVGSLALGVGLVVVLAEAVSDEPTKVTPIELVSITSSPTPSDSETTIASSSTVPVTADTADTADTAGSAVAEAPTTTGADTVVPVAPAPSARLAAPPPAPVAPPPPIAPPVVDDDDIHDDDDDDHHDDDDDDGSEPDRDD